MWVPPVHSPLTPLDALRALAGSTDEVRALEALLRTDLAADQVLLTASGTQALQRALSLGAGVLPEARRLVALPGYACFDLATAVLATDLPVTFYDLDPVTLAPDPASLERAVQGGAGLVVAANLYGLPLDWDFLAELGRTHDVVVIEDAAQAVGSTWRGRPAGGLGELSVLSFGRGKGWTGSGGGALLARGRFSSTPPDLPSPVAAPEGTVHVAGLAVRALAQWALARPTLYGLPAHLPGLGLGLTRFRPPERVTRITPYQAALALRTARHLEHEVDLRHERAANLTEVLSSYRTHSHMRPHAQGDASWLRMPIRVSGLPAALPTALRRLGVYRGYPKALADLPELAPRVRLPVPEIPVARLLVSELLTLPTHARVPMDRLLARLPVALDRARIDPSA